MDEVQNPQFWKERFEPMKDKPEWRFLSVYKTHPLDWHNICENHKRIIQNTVKGKVLDAGCAYGRASEWIKDYIGVDISPDFIAKAKELYPQKEFIVGDLKALPFATKDFDWAVCISIKAMLERELPGEWEKVKRELKRVARNILILEYSTSDKYEVIHNNA